MDALPPALAPLAARDQFVTWIAVPRGDKIAKLPTRWSTGEVCSAHDPNVWTNAECALAMAAPGGGAGWVFTAGDPYFFLDIDGALQADGRWSALAVTLCARLAGAAVEVSQSGRGLHIIGRYAGAAPLHACKNVALGLELYTADRFVALTGYQATGDADHDCTAALASVVADYFPPMQGDAAAEWTTEPVAEWSGPEDDDELVRRARNARSVGAAFGAGSVTFVQLYDADVDALAARYPGDTGPYDASSADMALANSLAFWTGKDCERMERIMRASALAREKWDSHRTYLEGTILRACAWTRQVYTQRTAPTPATSPYEEADLREAADAGAVPTAAHARGTAEHMGPAEQLQHFAGCWFVTEMGRVFALQRNELMARTSFDVVYGGRLFVLDPLGAKTTTSAWEAFTNSRVNTCPTVNDLCFRPELPWGHVVAEGHRAMVNSYVPYDCPTSDADPAPFLDLLGRMLPVERDRQILLTYMASMAQNPGVKFQWWPVIQGLKGNGKTMLLRVMTYVMGQQYTHLPSAHSLVKSGMQFNGWIYRKLFIGIDEIDLTSRRDFLEEMKVVVTSDWLAIEKKGVDQVSTDNRANGAIVTNHRAGMPIEADERRYAVFYCKQQHVGDLERDGMGGRYFPDLLAWFKAGGFAACARLLKTMPLIAEFDPAQLAHRAPHSSSHVEAIRASLGRAEQEVLDAIEEGRQGFAGGWVSSYYLDALLEGIRAPVPRNKRRDLMRSLGYDWHPVLTDGRVNDPVAPEGRKSKLYVRYEHVARGLTVAADVARAYAKAQEPVVGGATVVAFRG